MKQLSGELRHTEGNYFSHNRLQLSWHPSCLFFGHGRFCERILIVDDDSEIRQFLKTIIDSKERIVEAVGTMEEARAILETGSVDLLLLDLYLPDGNGIKLLSDLRERPKTI